MLEEVKNKKERKKKEQESSTILNSKIDEPFRADYLIEEALWKNIKSISTKSRALYF